MAEVNALISDAVKKFLNRLDEIGINIEAAYLYGSCVKGKQHKWSDIDVALISSDFGEYRFDERVRLTIIASEIDDRIEPVSFRPDDFIDEDPLVWEIKKDGIPLEIEHGINR